MRALIFGTVLFGLFVSACGVSNVCTTADDCDSASYCNNDQQCVPFGAVQTTDPIVLDDSTVSTICNKYIAKEKTCDKGQDNLQKKFQVCKDYMSKRTNRKVLEAWKSCFHNNDACGDYTTCLQTSYDSVFEEFQSSDEGKQCLYLSKEEGCFQESYCFEYFNEMYGEKNQEKTKKCLLESRSCGVYEACITKK